MTYATLRSAALTPSDPAPLAPAGPPDDYACVRRAIRYLTEEAGAQPSLADVADVMGLTETQAHSLFTRWAGLTPKGFLSAVTLDKAKTLLENAETVLDTAIETGLSGPGRLHDLFVTHTAMTPGAYKARGAGLDMVWGVHATPFGLGIFVTTEHGLAGIGFADEAGGIAAAADDLKRRWPAARYSRDDAAIAGLARRVFEPASWSADRPLRVVFIGSDFEIRVWETLLGIAPGRASTYSHVAAAIGRPKASRAVGGAVGRNPLSFVVPCHRVIGRSGALTGYHWGLTRKRAMLGWETGLTG